MTSHLDSPRSRILKSQTLSAPITDFIQIHETRPPKRYARIDAHEFQTFENDFTVSPQNKAYTVYKVVEDRGPAALSIPMSSRYIKDGDPGDETLQLHIGVPCPMGYVAPLPPKEKNLCRWNCEYQSALSMVEGPERLAAIRDIERRFVAMVAPFACFLVREKIMSHLKPQKVQEECLLLPKSPMSKAKKKKSNPKKSSPKREQFVIPEPEEKSEPERYPGFAEHSCFVYQGIQFTCAHTEKRTKGFFDGDHDKCIKTMNNRMLGLEEIIRAGEPGLYHPLCAIVQYFGYSVWASAVVPIADDRKSTLVYGAMLEEDVWWKCDDEANTIMKNVGRKLNLKGHWACKPPTNKDEEFDTRGLFFFTNCDLHIHRAKDNRLYIITGTQRLFPAVTTDNSLWPEGYYTRHIRPELLRGSKKNRDMLMPISSDAFSPFGLNRHDEHDREGALLTALLLEKLVPKTSEAFVQLIANCTTPSRALFLVAQRYGSISGFVHANGVNMRYLGRMTDLLCSRYLRCVAKQEDADPPSMQNALGLAVEVLRNEMTLRVIKKYIRGQLRIRAMDKIMEIVRGCLLFPPELEKLWTEVIFPLMNQKYGVGELSPLVAFAPNMVHPGLAASCLQRAYILTNIMKTTGLVFEKNGDLLSLDPYRDVEAKWVFLDLVVSLDPKPVVRVVQFNSKAIYPDGEIPHKLMQAQWYLRKIAPAIMQGSVQSLYALRLVQHCATYCAQHGMASDRMIVEWFDHYEKSVIDIERTKTLEAQTKLFNSLRVTHPHSRTRDNIQMQKDCSSYGVVYGQKAHIGKGKFANSTCEFVGVRSGFLWARRVGTDGAFALIGETMDEIIKRYEMSLMTPPVSEQEKQQQELREHSYKITREKPQNDVDMTQPMTSPFALFEKGFIDESMIKKIEKKSSLLQLRSILCSHPSGALVACLQNPPGMDTLSQNQSGNILLLKDGSVLTIVGVYLGQLWCLRATGLLELYPGDEHVERKLTTMTLYGYNDAKWSPDGGQTVLIRNLRVMAKFGVHFGQRIVLCNGPHRGFIGIVGGVTEDQVALISETDRQGKGILRIRFDSRRQFFERNRPELLGCEASVEPMKDWVPFHYRSITGEILEFDRRYSTTREYGCIYQGQIIIVVRGRFVGCVAVVIGVCYGFLWAHCEPHETGAVPLLPGQYRIVGTPSIYVPDALKQYRVHEEIVRQPFAFLTEFGEVVNLDIADLSCAKYGLYHGQRVRLARGPEPTRDVVVLGVFRGEMWVLEDGGFAATPLLGCDQAGIRTHYSYLCPVGLKRLVPFSDVFALPGSTIVLDSSIEFNYTEPDIVAADTESGFRVGFDISDNAMEPYHGLRSGDWVFKHVGFEGVPYRRCERGNEGGAFGTREEVWDWTEVRIRGEIIGVYEGELYFRLEGSTGAKVLTDWQTFSLQDREEIRAAAAAAEDLENKIVFVENITKKDYSKRLSESASSDQKEEVNEIDNNEIDNNNKGKAIGIEKGIKEQQKLTDVMLEPFIKFLTPERIEKTILRFACFPDNQQRKVANWILRQYQLTLRHSDSHYEAFRKVACVEEYFDNKLHVPDPRQWEEIIAMHRRKCLAAENSVGLPDYMIRDFRSKCYSYTRLLSIEEATSQPKKQKALIKKKLANAIERTKKQDFSKVVTLAMKQKASKDDNKAEPNISSHEISNNDEGDVTSGHLGDDAVGMIYPPAVLSAWEEARTKRFTKPSPLGGRPPSLFVYSRSSGEVLRFDISEKSCEPWGFLHGDVLEYQTDDLKGVRGVVLGVLDEKLWRYDETTPPSPAAPFLGRNRREVETLHVIVKIGKTQPRNQDPFFYLKSDASVVSFQTSREVCAQYGVFHGQRFVCTKPPPFLKLPPPIETDYLSFPLIIIVGVFEGRVYYMSDLSGAIAFTGIDMKKELGLVLLYSTTIAAYAPNSNIFFHVGENYGVSPICAQMAFDISPSLMSRYLDVGGEKCARHGARLRLLAGSARDNPSAFVIGVARGFLYRHMENDAGATIFKSTDLEPGGTGPHELADQTFRMNRLSAVVQAYRDVKGFRFMMATGKLAVFDISDQACEKYGLQHGQVLHFRGNGFEGRRAAVIGVRKDLLWKMEWEPEESFDVRRGATVFGHCVDAFTLHQIYNPVKKGQVVLEPFTG